MRTKKLLETIAIVAKVDLSNANWGGDLDGFYWVIYSNPVRARFWNPINRNSDAFSLLAKMPFRKLYISEIGATVSWRKNNSGHGFRCDEYIEDHNNDIEAATRFAIVCAAVAFEKSLKESKNEGH